MKPGGAMYPSHARIFMAPAHTEAGGRRNAEFQGSMEGWAEFVQDMKSYYQVDLDCLSDSFRTEQREYYLSTAQWADVHPSQLLGPGSPFKSYDLNKVTVEELKVRAGHCCCCCCCCCCCRGWCGVVWGLAVCCSARGAQTPPSSPSILPQ